MKFMKLDKWIKGLKYPLLIAGPCSAESEEQMMATAKELSKNEHVKIFRAGVWKPRTRPNSFEGHGEKALKWMQKVKEEYGFLTGTEVANGEHAKLALKYGVDVLWIGARTTVNPFSVQEIADAIKGSNVPVMIKNPVNMELALWIGAIERIYNAGIDRIVAIHRGFGTSRQSKYRNPPRWDLPIELKRHFPELPIICDPSHICGVRNLIQEVSQKAIDLDFEGLMIESHIDPDNALSDNAQQLIPVELNQMTKNIILKTEFSTDRKFDYILDEYRSDIDKIDSELIQLLRQRMTIVEKIGELKAHNNITALQMHRMKNMMDSRLERGKELNLDPTYIEELYNVIHTESLRLQTEIKKSTKD